MSWMTELLVIGLGAHEEETLAEHAKLAKVGKRSMESKSDSVHAEIGAHVPFIPLRALRALRALRESSFSSHDYGRRTMRFKFARAVSSVWHMMRAPLASLGVARMSSSEGSVKTLPARTAVSASQRRHCAIASVTVESVERMASGSTAMTASMPTAGARSRSASKTFAPPQSVAISLMMW